MLKEKAGVIAGTIWNALNETEGMTCLKSSGQKDFQILFRGQR